MCSDCVWFNWYRDGGDWCSKWSVKVDKENDFDCEDFLMNEREVGELIKFKQWYTGLNSVERMRWIYERWKENKSEDY